MFVNDGQFGFSLFRLATAALVQCLGLAAAAKTLAILAAFAWFFGIRAFAQQFASGATVWVAVIFTVLLPNVYGAPYPFGFADDRQPRPFAEALVFAGLAAVAARRDVVAILFIVAAALLHPILAMAGLGVLATVRRMEDKRWIWFCAISGALLIGAGGLGLPLVDRLFTAIDPSLRSLHEQRSPFPVSADVPRLSQDGVRRLCARDDAPA